MEKLTESEISLIKYFWEQKQDIERCSDFTKLKPKIKNEYPQILKAFYKFKKSIKVMNELIKSI